VLFGEWLGLCSERAGPSVRGLGERFRRGGGLGRVWSVLLGERFACGRGLCGESVGLGVRGLGEGFGRGGGLGGKWGGAVLEERFGLGGGLCAEWGLGWRWLGCGWGWFGVAASEELALELSELGLELGEGSAGVVVRPCRHRSREPSAPVGRLWGWIEQV
jgi:hypothetical protein